jgi:hypothetical protein
VVCTFSAIARNQLPLGSNHFVSQLSDADLNLLSFAREHQPPCTLKTLPFSGVNDRQRVRQRLLAFQSHYERSASPFNWTFTRHDLHALLAKIATKRLAPAA